MVYNEINLLFYVFYNRKRFLFSLIINNVFNSRMNIDMFKRLIFRFYWFKFG